jgi:putative membrane-bound dehydrogenase-like protein
MVPFVVLLTAVSLAQASPGAAAPAPAYGPATESRFPPLRVPDGFTATLFACDPLIEYPSALARGPRPGAVLVAVDFMTGLGTEIVRRDEIRLVEDTDGDGYADKATLYAGGFNSIEGLTYHDGTAYAMHAPFLTALKDRDGDGMADERRDLLSGLGLPPEENPVRLHSANGIVMGHDGWLYLALGDHGCKVPRPEGDVLTLEGGGILRCRADGSDLHVFATGLRNIYDVAPDEDLTVFVRDNENDGGDYKVRVCHSFFSADHGYPYLYYEQPDEALPPLADLGLGSSAGGLCYLETRFPPEYRGNLFFCEWGRAVVRYRPERRGSTFAPLQELEFASGAPNDPYGFRPTDLAVERDGSLLVADWADGQRPKRGRGRIYRISPAAPPPPAAPTRTAVSRSLGESIAALDSESYYDRIEAQAAIEGRGREGLEALRAVLRAEQLGARGRLHAVWVLAHTAGPAAIHELLALARKDPEPRVQAQAVRAVADLADPVLVRHRLVAGPGDSALAAELAALARGRDARVQLEVVSAVGRLGWAGVPGWIRKAVPAWPGDDRALHHAALQTLRRARNWSAVLDLLDEPDSGPLRALALRALAGRAEPAVADGLLARLQSEPDPVRRCEYAELLTRVHKRPGPWVYWGYRPPPRPPNTVSWERTKDIALALDRVLLDLDRLARVSLFERMQREEVPVGLSTLRGWLRDERDPGVVAALLASVKDPTSSAAGELLDLAASFEDGPVLVEALRFAGRLRRPDAAALPLRKLDSLDPTVRAAAIDALAKLGASSAGERVIALLDDPDARVRRASLQALRSFKEPRALPAAISALSDPETQLAAAQLIAELGSSNEAGLVTALAVRQPSAEILPLVVRTLTRWSEAEPAKAPELAQAVAVVQGASGVPLRWEAAGPLSPEAAAAVVERVGRASAAERTDGGDASWRTVLATSIEARVRLDDGKDAGGGRVLLAYTDFYVEADQPVQILGSSRGTWRCRLNGRSVHERDASGPAEGDAEGFDATLAKGANRILFELSPASGKVELQLRLRRRSSTDEHERLVEAALSRRGSAEAGRRLFFDVEKSQCVKCHRLGDVGERIGPALDGVGSRFSRIHVIESILEPSRTIAPGFETLVVVLKDGRVLTGTRAAESADSVTIGDRQGQKQVAARSEIEVLRQEAQSTMPDGLEKTLTADEFVDLIAFLASQ